MPTNKIARKVRNVTAWRELTSRAKTARPVHEVGRAAPGVRLMSDGSHRSTRHAPYGSVPKGKAAVKAEKRARQRERARRHGRA